MNNNVINNPFWQKKKYIEQFREQHQSTFFSFQNRSAPSYNFRFHRLHSSGLSDLHQDLDIYSTKQTKFSIYTRDLV